MKEKLHQQKPNTEIYSAICSPTKAAVSPTVFISSPAGLPLSGRFNGSYQASSYTVLLQGHLLKTWQWVTFHRYIQCFTLMLDSYQTDMTVIYQPGFGLMREIYQQQYLYILWWESSQVNDEWRREDKREDNSLSTLSSSSHTYDSFKSWLSCWLVLVFG